MYDRSKLKKAILLAFAKTDFTNEEIENLKVVKKVQSFIILIKKLQSQNNILKNP